MDESTRLSTVAIVVALLALFIALGQLLQQYFGTADGYRRCKDSVIGPWGKFTWLHWLLKEQGAPEKEAFGLGLPLLTKKAPGNLKGINSGLPSASAKYYWEKLLRFFQHLRRCPWSKIFSPNWRLSTGREAVDKSVHFDDNQNVPNDLLVTWVQLLRHLHNMYSAQWPGDCDRNVCAASYPLPANVEQGAKSRSADVEQGAISRPAVVEQRANPTRTDVYLFLQEHSWDFMPPDIVRPLATIRAGTLVILAMRLGMQWRTLRLGSGMQADGNGYSLTSSPVRGLGMIMQFTYDEPMKSTQSIIPSAAADMLMCGILPTCPRLFKADSGGRELSFKLIGDDRKVSFFWNIVNFLKLSEETVGMFDDKNEEFKNKDRHRGRPFTQPVLNDVFCVIMPFLPLEHSSSVDVLFSGWLGQVHSSVFHYWAARRALLVNLENQCHRADSPSQGLEGILTHFNHLETEYFGDFYFQEAKACIVGGCKADCMRVPCYFKGENVEKRRLNMLIDLRSIHLKTTKYFEELNNTTDEKLVKPQLRYVDLLAAHANMAFPAGQSAFSAWFHHNGRHTYDLNKDSPPGEYLEMYEQVCFYVENLNSLVKELEHKGCTMADEEIKEAWWMLMLRGVVWDMSVWCTPLEEEPVPASFYVNQTPLWIT